MTTSRNTSPKQTNEHEIIGGTQTREPSQADNHIAHPAFRFRAYPHRLGARQGVASHYFHQNKLGCPAKSHYSRIGKILSEYSDLLAATQTAKPMGVGLALPPG